MDKVRIKLRLSTLEGLKNKNEKEIQLAEGREGRGGTIL
jgi:hypothetical protein